MTSHDATPRTEALAWLADRMAWEHTLDHLRQQADATGAPVDLTDRTDRTPEVLAPARAG